MVLLAVQNNQSIDNNLQFALMVTRKGENKVGITRT